MRKENTSKLYAIRLKPDIVSQIEEYKIANGFESDTEPLLHILKRGLESIKANE